LRLSAYGKEIVRIFDLQLLQQFRGVVRHLLVGQRLVEVRTILITTDDLNLLVKRLQDAHVPPQNPGDSVPGDDAAQLVRGYPKQPQITVGSTSPLFEIGRMLIRLDHVANFCSCPCPSLETTTQRTRQDAMIAQLKSAVAQHQEEIRALKAGLKEQAWKTEKVSAQVEMSKSAARVVAKT
jgi:hypothetical protein